MAHTIKKIISTIGIALSTTAFTVGVASATYLSYINQKQTSNVQFDFDSENIPDHEVVIDGIKDSQYGSTPILSFGVNNKAVKLYFYRTKQAMYMYFDVDDSTVTTRAIGDNNAQDEDGIEMNIDVLLNGGNAPQKDDLRIYLAANANNYSKVIRGTGTDWDTSTLIGFGATMCTSFKEGTTVNDNTGDPDPGYCIEYRIPYVSFFNGANEKTPFGFSFIQTVLDDYSGKRDRKGMGGHPTFKIPNADIPSCYIVLYGNSFYTRSQFENLTTANKSSVVGTVIDSSNTPLSNVRVEGYYSNDISRKCVSKTDNNGNFMFENIKSETDFVVTASKTDYLDTTLIYDKNNLALANGAEYSQTFTMLASDSETAQVSGFLTAFTGDALSNFKVSVLGHPNITAKTNSSGEYKINVYKNVENVLMFEKSGYEKQYMLSDGLSNVETFEMRKSTTTVISPKKASLISNYATVETSRCSSSVFVKALTPYEIDNGEFVLINFNNGNYSSFGSNYRNGDYEIKYDGKDVFFSEYNEETASFEYNQQKSSQIKVNKKTNVLVEYSFDIPFSIMNLTSTSVYGLAAAFFDGAKYQESVANKEIVKDEYIDFYSTATYMRFDKSGNPYFAPNNKENDFLYFYHAVDGALEEDIPNNADLVYATYTRDNDGLNIEVTVSSGFDMHFNPRYLTGLEAINVILNLDGNNLDAWRMYKDGLDCYDINFRIYSDNTICYANSYDFKSQGSNQLWWSDKSHNNGTAKNFIIDAQKLDSKNYEAINEKGCFVYKLHFTYEELAIIAGAPNNVTLSKSSPISMLVYEVSETSKTTIRFYTSSGDGWIYKNNKFVKTVGTFSNQANYISLS